MLLTALGPEGVFLGALSWDHMNLSRALPCLAMAEVDLRPRIVVTGAFCWVSLYYYFGAFIRAPDVLKTHMGVQNLPVPRLMERLGPLEAWDFWGLV